MKVQLSIFCVLLLSLSVRAQGNVCAGLFWGQIVADPDRCDRYFVCIFTIPRAVNCPDDHVFDLSQKACVPGDQETCEIFGNGTTTRPTDGTTTGPTDGTTTGPSTIETTHGPAPPDLKVICEGVFFGARPYPESIQNFVGCIRENGVLFKCNEDEYFQPLINECVDWENPTNSPPESSSQASTTGQPEPTPATEQPEPTTFPTTIVTTPDPTISTTPEASTERPNACIGIDFGFIAHPEHCDRYIFCNNQAEYQMYCKENMIYDETINDCRYGDPETCQFLEENSVPTTEIFAPCDGIQNGVVADGDSCTRYYRCFMGSHVAQNCNPGQIFSQERMMCVDGNTETCTVDDA